LQLSAAAEEEDEILSTAPRNSRRDEWLRRAEGQRSQLHAALRDKVFEWAAPARHARVLVLGRGMELFLFEAARRCPEGLVVGLCEDTARAESLIALKEKHVGDDPAEALHIEPMQTDWQERLLGYSEAAGYELIMMRDGGLHASDRLGFFTALRGLLSPGGRLVAAERIADAVPKLSALLTARLNSDRADAALIGRLKAAEALFYSGEHHGAYGWTSTAIHQVLTAAKFSVRAQTTLRQNEKRRIAHTDIQNWIPQNPADAKDKSYGAALLTGTQGLSEDEYRQTAALIHEHLGATEHSWPLQYCLFHVEPA